MPKGEAMIIAYFENGESKQREATAEEVAYIEAAQAEAAATKEAQAKEEAAQAAAKAALLDRLGLTADEAKLLLA